MNKGQIKMGESIAIVIVFFFIVVFGLIFYSGIERGSIEQDVAELNQLRAISVTQAISFLPEVQCRFNNIPITDCFDIIKMNIFNDIITQDLDAQLYYFDLLGYSTITISQIYPPSSTVWALYDHQKNSTYKTVTSIPISLFNATAGTYGIGILHIEVYQ